MPDNRVTSVDETESDELGPEDAMQTSDRDKVFIELRGHSARILRHPKTRQEKLLCYFASFLFLAILMLIAVLCIVNDRWKTSLKQPHAPYVDKDEVCFTPACKETAEKLMISMDRSVDPCVDFYQHVCGRWDTKFNESETKYHTGFQVLEKRHVVFLSDLLERNDSDTNQSRSVRNVKSFFRGCKHEARDMSSDEGLVDLVHRLGGWPMVDGDGWSADDYRWPESLAAVNRMRLDVLLETGITTYVMNNSQTVIYLSSPDLIFNHNFKKNGTDEGTAVNVTRAYLNYMVQAALHLGSTEDMESLEASALDVLEFELELRNLSKSSSSGYRNVSHLQSMLEDEDPTINFNWAEYLTMVVKGPVGVDEQTLLVVYGLEYVKKIPQLISNTDVRIVANYIAWAVVYYMTDYSSSTLRNISYPYDVLLGASSDSDEDDVCFSIVNSLMGLAVGRVYVDTIPRLEIREDVMTMVDMIRLAYSSTLLHNKWMDFKTKKGALDKLKEMDSMIVYPPWILDDEKLDNFYKIDKVDEEDFFSVVLQLIVERAELEYSFWNKTLNRSDLGIKTEPILVNAFYRPTTNSMTLPVGILGYPMYEYGRIDSMNYGAFGSIIGHEISHAFDTKGSIFDKVGNRRNWWTKNTKRKFLSKSRCLAEQYSQIIEPLTQSQVNGNRTLAENIADNGGLRNAFKAYRLHTALYDTDRKRQKLPGMTETPEQLFFIGYAGVWCSTHSKKSMEKAMKNVHSPGYIRVLVPLSNYEEFARAYKCAPGTPMNPIEKCQLW